MTKRRQKSNADKLATAFWQCHNAGSNMFGIVTKAKMLKVHQIKHFFEKVERCPHYKLLEGILVPETYSHLFIRGLNERGATDLHELQWQCSVIKKHGNQISQFVSKRKKFGKSLVLGNYNDAEKALLDIIETSGTSLYSLEKQFLLVQMNHGLAENKKLLEEYHNSDSDNLLKFICLFFSQKVESLINYEVYEGSISSKLDHLPPDDPIDLYLRALFGISDLKDGAFYLFLNERLSLIDRYLGVLKYIRSKVCGADDNERRIILDVVRQLKDHIDDAELDNLEQAYSDFTVQADKCCLGEEFLDAMDAYSSGDFHAALSLGLSLIRKLPTAYQFYELSAKSMAYSGEEFSSVTTNDSLANNILKNLYSLFLDKESVEPILCNLETIALNLGDNNLSNSILNCVRWEREGTVSAQSVYNSCLTSKTINPYDYLHFDTEISRQQISNLKDLYGERPSIAFLLLAVSGSEEIHISPDVKSSIIYQMLHLEICMRNGEISAVLHKCKELLSSNECVLSSNNLKGKVLKLYFDALYQKNGYVEAMDLVSQSYASNENLMRHTMYNRVLNPDILKRIENVNANINLPIIEYLVSDNVQEVYSAVDRYFRAIKCVKPTDYLEHAEGVPLHSTKLFLWKVLSLKVMSRGPRFASSTDELETQRVRLLAYLYFVDSSNKHLYEQEMAELSKEKLNRQTLQQVNPTKIFVGIDSIKEAFFSNNESGFERFVEFKEAESKVQHKRIDGGKLLMRVKESVPKTSDQDKQKSEDFVSEHRSLLLGMFFEIWGTFILESEASLNHCLSNKIRHGKIENHIRRPFEKNHLLCKKGSNDEYERIAYWESKHGATDEMLCHLDSALSEFTASIRDVYRVLKAEILHFRFGDVFLEFSANRRLLYNDLSQENGLFDYRDIHQQKGVIYERLCNEVTINDFFDKAIEIIWDFTGTQLDSVKRYLRVDVVSQVKRCLGQLTKATDEIVMPEDIRKELALSIQTSRNMFDSEITHIISWFNRPQQRKAYDIPLIRLVESVQSHINSCTDNHLANLQVEIDPNVVIRAEQTSTFHDITYNLLQNIVNHSRLRKERLVGEFRCNVTPEGLELCVSNKVKRKSDLAASLQVASELLQSLYKGTVKFGESAKEERSGLIKIWEMVSKLCEGDCFHIRAEGESTSCMFLLTLTLETKHVFKINSDD